MYEFTHKDVISGRVRENEYEHLRQHILKNQATGMLVHAQSATQLGGLPIGSTNQALVVSASGLPEWVSGPTFTTLTLTGKLTLSPSARITTHLEISGTDKLASGEQALLISFPSETLATNGIWITLKSTVTSGDLTGIRSRVTGNATSNGANVRGGYLEAKAGAGKYAAMLEGALIHADYSAGNATISGDVRGLTVHISTGTNLTAANLYGILLNIQTRGSESISSDDIGLLIRNEAVGGNGRMMDSGLTLAGLNMGGGVRPFAVDITFQGGATLYDDGTWLTLAGAKLKAPGADFTAAVTGISLSEIENLEADKTFVMAAKNLHYTFTTPSEGITLDVTGAFSDHIFHIHQHTGNPGVGAELIHLLTEDSDVIPLHIEHSGNNASFEALEFELHRSSPTDGDNIVFGWHFWHDGALTSIEQVEFAKIKITAIDVSEDNEDAKYTLSLMKAGSMTDIWAINSAGVVSAPALTMPAFTLGGNIACNGQDITSLNRLSFSAGNSIIMTVDNQWASMRGGTLAAGSGANILAFGKDNAQTGAFWIYTPNAAGNDDVLRVAITGKTAEAVMALTLLNVTGLKLGSALTLNGQAFDAGSGSAQINSTGAGKGLIIEVNAAAALGPTLTLRNAASQIGDQTAILFYSGSSIRAQILSRVGASPFHGNLEFYAGITSLNLAMTLNSDGLGWFDVGVDADEYYKVAGTQVVSARGAAVADPTDPASTQARLTDLLGRLRTHGLIAT